MKETKLHLKDAIDNVAENKIKKEIKLTGSQRKIPNHILWEYNTITKELSRASFTQIDYILDFTKPDPAKDLLNRIKVLTKPDCKYFQALNKENALKKINNNKI